MYRLAALVIAVVLVALLGFLGNSASPAPLPANARRGPDAPRVASTAVGGSKVEHFVHDFGHSIPPSVSECRLLDYGHGLGGTPDLGNPSVETLDNSGFETNVYAFQTDDGWKLTPGGVVRTGGLGVTTKSITVAVNLRVTLSTTSVSNTPIASIDFGTCRIGIGTRNLTWDNGGQYIAESSSVVGASSFWVAVHLRPASATAFIFRRPDDVVSNTVSGRNVHPHNGTVAISMADGSIGEVVVKKIVVFRRETADKADIARVLGAA